MRPRNSRIRRWLVALAICAVTLTAQFSGGQAVGRSQHATGTRFGVVVDGVHKITATAAQLAELGATWERSVVGNRRSSGTKRRDDWCRGGQASLGKVFASSAGWIMVFDNQSCSRDAPIWSTSATAWEDYIRLHYIPGLRDFLNANRRLLVTHGSGAMIEVWNEEDCLGTGAYIPPSIYVVMLTRAVAAVEAWDRAEGARVRTAMGGLCAPRREVIGHSTYLQTVLELGGAALRPMGPVGLHVSYGTPEPLVWTAELEFFRSLLGRYSVTDGRHKIWITESGADGQVGDRGAQASLAALLFGTLRRAGVPVVVWYAFDDRILDSAGDVGWGLFDDCGLLKPSGAVFEEFARHLDYLPPAGSPTGERMVGIETGGRSLKMVFRVWAKCPSRAGVPRGRLSISNEVRATPDGETRTHTTTSSYKVGGRLFMVGGTAGAHWISGGYGGDAQLEGGSSRTAVLHVGVCPGPLWPAQLGGANCIGQIARAASLILSAYGSASASLGAPVAGGAILGDRGYQIAFFRHVDLVVRRGRVQKVRPAGVLRLLTRPSFGR